MDELETVVYNKDNKLTIFEEIYDKISAVEAERRTVEAKMLNDHARILATFKEHEFKFENNHKQVKTMIQSAEHGLNEMSELKLSVQEQSKAFMENIG